MAHRQPFCVCSTVDQLYLGQASTICSANAARLTIILHNITNLHLPRHRDGTCTYAGAYLFLLSWICSLEWMRRVYGLNDYLGELN